MNSVTQPRLEKQSALRCTLCGRKLTRPGTHIPAIGVVGPECEKHASDAVAFLSMNGLEALVLTGEARIPMGRNVGGTLAIPQGAIDLGNAARRVGLELTCQWLPGEHGARLKDPRQLLRPLRREPTVLPTARPYSAKAAW